MVEQLQNILIGLGEHDEAWEIVLGAVGLVGGWLGAIFVAFFSALRSRKTGRELEKSEQELKKVNQSLSTIQCGVDGIFTQIRNATHSEIVRIFREFASALPKKIDSIRRALSDLKKNAEKILDQIIAEEAKRPVFRAKVDRLKGQHEALVDAILSGESTVERLERDRIAAEHILSDMQAGRWNEAIAQDQLRKLEKLLANVKHQADIIQMQERVRALALAEGKAHRELMEKLRAETLTSEAEVRRIARPLDDPNGQSA